MQLSVSRVHRTRDGSSPQPASFRERAVDRRKVRTIDGMQMWRLFIYTRKNVGTEHSKLHSTPRLICRLCPASCPSWGPRWRSARPRCTRWSWSGGDAGRVCTAGAGPCRPGSTPGRPCRSPGPPLGTGTVYPVPRERRVVNAQTIEIGAQVTKVLCAEKIFLTLIPINCFFFTRKSYTSCKNRKMAVVCTCHNPDHVGQNK